MHLKRGNKLVNCAHDLLKQGDELVSRGNVLLTCGLDINIFFPACHVWG